MMTEYGWYGAQLGESGDWEWVAGDEELLCAAVVYKCQERVQASREGAQCIPTTMDGGASSWGAQHPW